jgi:hypothetical protein
VDAATDLDAPKGLILEDSPAHETDFQQNSTTSSQWLNLRLLDLQK